MGRYALAAVLSLAVISCKNNPGKDALGVSSADPAAGASEKIEKLISQMTIPQKVAMVHAQSKFSSPGVGPLGIPEVWCTDGPHGIPPRSSGTVALFGPVAWSPEPVWILCINNFYVPTF